MYHIIHLFNPHLVVHLAVNGVHAAVEAAVDIAAEEHLVRAEFAVERSWKNCGKIVHKGRIMSKKKKRMYTYI